jgi:hypothetical protein
MPVLLGQCWYWKGNTTANGRYMKILSLSGPIRSYCHAHGRDEPYKLSKQAREHYMNLNDLFI